MGTAWAPFALASGPAPRHLESPAARRLHGGSASEYWDLTIELEQGYTVVARFLSTNQGPGKQSGIAIGHIISPDGTITKFQNGKRKSRWTLSKDGQRLDIGKCHLDMHSHRYALSVTKSAAAIELVFAPNTLYRLPEKILGSKYQVDLLALGAVVRGSVRVGGMSSPLPVKGWATLTHTISLGAETDVALRRIELFSQRGKSPFYLSDFLDPAGRRSLWFGYLDSACDPDIPSQEPVQSELKPGASVKNMTDVTDVACMRRLIGKTEFDLSLGNAMQSPAKIVAKNPYWIPLVLNLKPRKPEGLEGNGNNSRGKVFLAEHFFLSYEPLADLPGPIRFFARLSTRPRRVWSVARFDVTIVTGLSSKLIQAPIQAPIQIQGQGLATVSFLNPVTRP